MRVIRKEPFYLGTKEKENSLNEAIKALESNEFDKAINIIQMNSNIYADEFHDARSLIGQIKLIAGIVQKHQAKLKMAEHEIKMAKSKWFPWGSKEDHIIVATNYLKSAQQMAGRFNAQMRGIMILFEKMKIDGKKIVNLGRKK